MSAVAREIRARRDVEAVGPRDHDRALVDAHLNLVGDPADGHALDRRQQREFDEAAALYQSLVRLGQRNDDECVADVGITKMNRLAGRFDGQDNPGTAVGPGVDTNGELATLSPARVSVLQFQLPVRVVTSQMGLVARRHREAKYGRARLRILLHLLDDAFARRAHRPQRDARGGIEGEPETTVANKGDRGNGLSPIERDREVVLASLGIDGNDGRSWPEALGMAAQTALTPTLALGLGRLPRVPVNVGDERKRTVCTFR